MYKNYENIFLPILEEIIFEKDNSDYIQIRTLFNL